MADLPNLSSYCCRVTVTTTATPLATLIKSYFTTNYPNTYTPNVNSALANLQSSTATTTTIVLGDRLLNIGSGLGIGFELQPTQSFFFPEAAGMRQSIDLNSYSVAVAAGTGVLNIVCNGG